MKAERAYREHVAKQKAEKAEQKTTTIQECNTMNHEQLTAYRAGIIDLILKAERDADRQMHNSHLQCYHRARVGHLLDHLGQVEDLLESADQLTSLEQAQYAHDAARVGETV